MSAVNWQLLEEVRYQAHQLKMRCAAVCHDGYRRQKSGTAPEKAEYTLMKDTDAQWMQLARMLQACTPFRPEATGSEQVRISEPALNQRLDVAASLSLFLGAAESFGRKHNLIANAKGSEARLWTYSGPTLAPALHSAADTLQEYMQLGLRDQVLARLAHIAANKSLVPQKLLALPAPSVPSQPRKPL